MAPGTVAEHDSGSGTVVETVAVEASGPGAGIDGCRTILEIAVPVARFCTCCNGVAIPASNGGCKAKPYDV